jgi:transposase-like protein
MKAQKRITYRYSEAFKVQVVKEVEEGLSTISEVRRKYGIPGGDTVQQWIKRMGKLALLTKVIRVEKPDEKARIKELERQIRQLKESLADTQVRYLLAETQFEIVCQQQGLNPEEVKKKLEEKPSSEQ